MGSTPRRSIVDDADVLLEFHKYPPEHWVHLCITNPIESTFATVCLRTKVSPAIGPGSRAAAMAMDYKMIDAAQARWGRNAPHLVALVRAALSSAKANCSNAPSTSPHPSQANQPKGRAKPRGVV